MAVNYNYGPSAANNPFNFPTFGNPNDPEYIRKVQEAQRREQDANARLRDFQALMLSAANQAAQYNQQLASQGAYDQIARQQGMTNLAQARTSLAGQQYGMGNEQLSNTLRIEQSRGDLEQLRNSQARDVKGLELQLAEQGLREQIDKYRRSVSEVPSGFASAARRYGY